MAIVIGLDGSLIDTEGRINFSPEGSDVLPPNPFLSPDTADSAYANLLGLPANQDMGFLYGVPQRADDQGYFIGLPGTADDVFPFEPPGTADDRIANLISVPGTSDDVFPFAAANRTYGLPNLNLESLPVNMGVANEADDEDDETGKKKSNGIFDLLMSVVMPGYNFLKNMGGKNYQFTDPRGSFRGGIYSMDGVNYPRASSFGGEFYDPETGTNRFDRAKDRFRVSRNLKDLFAASRTGAEFANAKKILDFQNQPGNYKTDFMDRPKSQRNFTGQAPKGTTAFDTKSGMGRRGYYKGGIASLYG